MAQPIGVTIWHETRAAPRHPRTRVDERARSPKAPHERRDVALSRLRTTSTAFVNVSLRGWDTCRFGNCDHIGPRHPLVPDEPGFRASARKPRRATHATNETAATASACGFNAAVSVPRYSRPPTARSPPTTRRALRPPRERTLPRARKRPRGKRGPNPALDAGHELGQALRHQIRRDCHTGHEVAAEVVPPRCQPSQARRRGSWPREAAHWRHRKSLLEFGDFVEHEIDDLRVSHTRTVTNRVGKLCGAERATNVVDILIQPFRVGR